jgi:lipid-A-disaccharide synthase
MRLFLSAGEPSGDLHAANLIRAVRRRRPNVEFLGFGGPRMEEAGAEVLFPLVDLAIMWFGRVLLRLHRFVGVIVDADRVFRARRPDAVILIDYPGLHWWIAWRAKARRIPVFYYVPPQLWAWGGWRVKKVRTTVDLVLCSLPFEPAWYQARGVPQAVYVGHPYFDELAHRTLDDAFLAEQRARGGPVVAILPGSRTQEIHKNFGALLRAAARLAAHRPDVRFVVACLHDRHRDLVRELVAASGTELALEVHAARTPELIRLADVAWAVSGSVGLELMVEALPAVVLYTVRPFELWVARHFIKAKFISLVNLLADAEVMPEYLTGRDVSAALADWARRWLDDPAARAQVSSALAAVRDRVAVPGASDRAADRILAALAAATPAQARPSYQGLHDRTGVEPGVAPDAELPY